MAPNQNLTINSRVILTWILSIAPLVLKKQIDANWVSCVVLQRTYLKTFFTRVELLSDFVEFYFKVTKFLDDLANIQFRYW